MAVSNNRVEVFNNALPEVFVDNPLANPDSSGPIQLRFEVRDEELDRVDVVLQWSREKDSFPDIGHLADPAVRSRILADLDERAPLRIISPRPPPDFRCAIKYGKKMK